MVTDHRINLTLHKLNEFMEGEIFDEMIESLSLRAQEEELKKLEKKYYSKATFENIQERYEKILNSNFYVINFIF